MPRSTHAAILAGLAALVAWASFAQPAQSTLPADQPPQGPVYVIPIRGAIEPALLYVLRRGLTEADAVGARAIIFVMDTPGGTVQAAREIVLTIQKIRVPTITFVEKHAFSAGAIIALGTRHIYMAPGSVIGDALPVMMTPWGGVQEMPEAIQEKTISGVASLIRAAAEQGGHSPQLAEAMVRRELEFKLGDDLIKPAGQLLTLTNLEAERKVGSPPALLLSSGTVEDLPALLKVAGLEGAELRELQVTVVERIARWIAALAPLFLIGGILGIYVEIKTPGFGVPGILGILCLAVFFWGHHVAGLAGFEDILLFVLGVTLVALEVFVLPGMLFLGIIGMALMLWSLMSAMIRFLPGGTWPVIATDASGALFSLIVTVIGVVAVAILVGRLYPRLPVLRHLVLEQAVAQHEGYAASSDTEPLVGRTGRALNDLRPAGTAVFDDRRLDVVSLGDYIQTGRMVRIVQAHGSRIVVEAVPDSDVGTES